MKDIIDLSSNIRINGIYSVFKQKRASKYYFKGEKHSMWEIVIVSEGKIGVTAGSDAFYLGKGQAIIHEPWEFHKLWSESDDVEIIVFTLLIENMPKNYSKIFEVKNLEIPDKIVKEIYASFEMKNAYVSKIGDEKKKECFTAIKNLEIFILSTVSKEYKNTPVEKSRSSKNYSVIINVLKNNLDKNLSLDDIAHLCNMSRANVIKTFKKYAGTGVMNFYNEMKIDMACSMLNSHMSVKEISDALGFLNQNYFSSVFKKIKGKAPSKY